MILPKRFDISPPRVGDAQKVSRCDQIFFLNNSRYVLDGPLFFALFFSSKYSSILEQY